MFAQNLRYLRESHNLSQAKLAEYLNRKSTSSISEWEAEKYTPKLETVEKIARFFKVSATDLLQMDLSRDSSLLSINSVYDNLSKKNKHKVINYAQQLKREEQNKVISFKVRELAIAGVVSAGTGEEFAEEDDVINYEGLEPAHDYALRVNGNSMEPLLHDGQIIFVKETTEPEYNGQIVIAYVDRRAYVKQYKEQDGRYLLISLNQDYEPIDVTNNASFSVKGVVVGS